ncbi:hypothetical protein C7974DRAFT_426002 [Boeremia exigua]|uniref:uncharacterized protein n=1 Tax=Boeremia exigua TaxID=749465 RepID=UPI001E8CFBE6|nr:uncharacterized protein C7974DRAFT_426002 [Boeremia exigua]KAH6622315.1 hypothetical protein C7974DRAFT_426002 [Boeremia exigua]
MSPIPIIVCGRSPAVAAKVARELAPEYDVVKIVLTPEDGVASIPALLSGPNAPRCVAVGGAFDSAAIEAMRSAASAAAEVPWLRIDVARMGEMPSLADTEAFGEALAVRIREGLVERKVGKEGQQIGVFLI